MNRIGCRLAQPEKWTFTLGFFENDLNPLAIFGKMMITTHWIKWSPLPFLGAAYVECLGWAVEVGIARCQQSVAHEAVDFHLWLPKNMYKM